MTTHQIKRYLSAIPDSVPHRVAGMDWIKWPVCIGLGGRIDWITQPIKLSANVTAWKAEDIQELIKRINSEGVAA